MQLLPATEPTAPPSAFAAVDRLFARQSLGAVHRVELLSGGQLNTALRVNGDLVLRCREASLSTGSLQREAVLLNRLRGRVPVPEVVATGVDHLLGEYIIQQWVPGKSLLRAWLETPDTTSREWWMVQWTAALRALHEERFPRPGELPEGKLKESPSWRSYIEGRIRKRLDRLMRVATMDRNLILAAERYTRRQAPVLEDGPFCLIHRDIHFGNALVDGPHLTALLDFELAEVGPPDYELDTLFRFLRYPWQFMAAGAETRVTPARFASVWFRLKRGYPELFAVRYLRERLCLYALDHALSCLLQAYSGRVPTSTSGTTAIVEGSLARIREILNGTYGPE